MSGHRSLSAISAFILFAFPVIVIPLVGIRDLRIDGLRHFIGIGIALLASLAAWHCGARTLFRANDPGPRFALAGGLLIAPFTLIALLWIGLGTPWEATPAENRMRYLVLLASSIAVTGGFHGLSEILHDSGERFFSALGRTANLLAGVSYLIWTCYEIGIYALLTREEQIPNSLKELTHVFDIILFAACVLTYTATIANSLALGRIGWLGRKTANVYTIMSAVALAFIVLRGLSFPDPKADSLPWFARPGFIAGIPAVPWIIPHLIGVHLLRRANMKTLPPQ